MRCDSAGKVVSIEMERGGHRWFFRACEEDLAELMEAMLGLAMRDDCPLDEDDVWTILSHVEGSLDSSGGDEIVDQSGVERNGADSGPSIQE